MSDLLLDYFGAEAANFELVETEGCSYVKIDYGYDIQYHAYEAIPDEIIHELESRYGV